MIEVLSVLLLIALAAGALLLVKQRQDASGTSQEQRAELRDAKRGLRQVQAEYTTAIKVAERDIKKASKSYQRQIDVAQKQLKALQDPRGKKLAAFQKHTLYEHAIVTPNGESNLEGVRAEVDTAGNLTTKSRSTLTRMAAGGVLLGGLGSILSMGLKKTKEIDKRELYLLVDAPSAPSVVQCPPDDGLKAREFAAKVNAAASVEAAYRQRLPALLDQGQQQLQAAKDATGPVESAQTDLARATNDPDALAAIERAQGQLVTIEEFLTSGEQPALPTSPGAAPVRPAPPTSPPPE
ncbi:MAG: hypothetical protein WEB03_13700 [Nitriliruptor sp.]|uniref:hypothetical protein n=1 Tax=Nitriliruptor sp. TaxID=2448056 RepID=UPI0034A060F0